MMRHSSEAVLISRDSKEGWRLLYACHPWPLQGINLNLPVLPLASLIHIMLEQSPHYRTILTPLPAASPSRIQPAPSRTSTSVPYRPGHPSLNHHTCTLCWGRQLVPFWFPLCCSASIRPASGSTTPSKPKLGAPVAVSTPSCQAACAAAAASARGLRGAQAAPNLNSFPPRQSSLIPAYLPPGAAPPPGPLSAQHRAFLQCSSTSAPAAPLHESAELRVLLRVAGFSLQGRGGNRS